MTLAGWRPPLAMGHPELDAQHQELFRCVDRLVQAMLAGAGLEVEPLFDSVGRAFVEHFTAEEQLMRESEFPGYNVHRAAHVRFVRDLQALRQLAQSRPGSAGVAVKAQTWLGEWLRTHVAGVDRQLGRHLLDRPA